QDPSFRRLFYEVLLPDLKAEGRTLIVISHDDRYFHVADYVAHMEKGNLRGATKICVG
ncbi:cyclic peptide export ABC transporter, partial [Agrobacterium sp. S2]|nr:cyclic peptide export ABC transporter [Agrobacterium sp. S2]